MKINNRCLSLRFNTCLILNVLSLMVTFSSCSKSKDGAGGVIPPATSEEDNADIIIHYTDLPKGEVSVFQSDSEVIGKSAFTCETNGYGLAIYKSQTTSQTARVCCINLDKKTNNSKFVSEDSIKTTIKPNSCDVAVIVSKQQAYNDLTLDLRDQQLVLLNGTYGLVSSSQINLNGGLTKKTTIAPISKGESITFPGKLNIDNILFSDAKVQYVTNMDSDFISIKNSTLKGSVFTLIDMAGSSNHERKTSFENLKIYQVEQTSSLVLMNYPFMTAGIELIAHAKMPSHVILKGTISVPVANLKQQYPIVPSSVRVSRGSLLNINAGATLWSSTDVSFTNPMFSLDLGSRVNINGESTNRNKLEAFPRLDGLAKTFQDFNSESNYGDIKLSHVDIDSIKFNVTKSTTLEIEDASYGFKPEYPRSEMASKGFKISGSQFVALSGGTVKILSNMTLKQNTNTDFFAYTRCGKIEGLGNLLTNGQSVLDIGTPAILVTENNDGMVANNCTEFYRNDGKKQIIQNKAIAVATSNNSFIEQKSCAFTYFTSSSWNTNFAIDCFMVKSASFENVSIISDGHTYWTGLVSDDPISFGGNNWVGTKSKSNLIQLKDPSGKEMTYLGTRKHVLLAVPEDETHDAFVLEASEAK